MFLVEYDEPDLESTSDHDDLVDKESPPKTIVAGVTRFISVRPSAVQAPGFERDTGLGVPSLIIDEGLSSLLRGSPPYHVPLKNRFRILYTANVAWELHLIA